VFGKVHHLSKQHRADERRVSVYIRSVAAYKHIPLLCAMLANNYPSLAIRSMVQSLRKQRAAPQPPEQRAVKLQSRKTSIAHDLHEEQSTTRVRSILLSRLWQLSGTTVEPRPEPLRLPLPDIMKRCYVQPSGGLHVQGCGAFVSQSRKRPLIRFNPSRISSCCELKNNCSCKSPG
jgi:hypothetical protein